MTLFNVDKGSDDRINPSVNADDVHLNRKSHATDSISPRAVGTQTGAKIITKNSKIIANDGSNNIGLFGFDDAGNMVVKVAKPGFDANNAANSNLVFNSAQDVFKIVGTGTATIPSVTTATVGAGVYDDARQTVTIAHSLGYAPIILAFSDLGNGFQALPSSNFVSLSTGSAQWFSVSAYATTAEVFFESAVLTVSGTGTRAALIVKYYLLQETAS